MDAMRDNPLLDFSGLPRFDAISPEHIGPAIDALLAQAEAKAARALELDQVSANYTLVSVMFALVLFFVAVGNKSSGRIARRMLFGLSLLTFAGTLAVMLSFPIAP